MPATAATIQIALEAQTAQLRRGFAQTRQSVDNLGQSLSGKVAAGMAKFHVALAAVKGALAAMRGAINAVAQAMARLDEEAKVAASVGAAADQIKILNFAAEQTGASATVMQESLRRMTRRIGEAAKGSGEAKQALADLGLSAERMMGLSADQQFAAIADAMGSVATKTEKMQLAMDIFGRQGGQLVNTMEGGSAALNEYGQQLQGLGALLGDNRGAVEAANDAINRMKQAWSGLVARIAIVVSPVIEAVSNLLGKLIAQFNRLFGSATGTAGKMQEFGRATATATASMAPLTEKIEEAGEAAVDKASKARDIVAKIKSEFAEAIKPEMAIGAVTRGTASGFSAVQQAQRAERDAERRDRRRNELLERIATALSREGLTIKGVELGL